MDGITGRGRNSIGQIDPVDKANIAADGNAGATSSTSTGKPVATNAATLVMANIPQALTHPHADLPATSRSSPFGAQPAPNWDVPPPRPSGPHQMNRHRYRKDTLWMQACSPNPIRACRRLFLSRVSPRRISSPGIHALTILPPHRRDRRPIFHPKYRRSCRLRAKLPARSPPRTLQAGSPRRIRA
jgi:hypothetical protein